MTVRFDRKNRGPNWMTRSAVALGLAFAIPVSAAVTASEPHAHAAFNPAGQDFWVESSMGPIKSRVFRAANGNTRRVAILLDGLRARDDLNGWEIETDVPGILRRANINVVMPVGGQSSFYSDWYRPSPGAVAPPGARGTYPGKLTTYKWETFLTGPLRRAMQARLGFTPTHQAIVGLSMGGTAALTIAAHHPDQFAYAASLSGYLNPAGAGMPAMIQAALMDQGKFDVNAMWGPPWDPAWRRNDPSVNAPMLVAENMRLWISAASGLPGQYDHPDSMIGMYNTGNAMGLESIAANNTHTFQAAYLLSGGRNAVFDYPIYGTHSWGWWSDEIVRMLPDLSAHL